MLRMLGFEQAVVDMPVLAHVSANFTADQSQTSWHSEAIGPLTAFAYFAHVLPLGKQSANNLPA